MPNFVDLTLKQATVDVTFVTENQDARSGVSTWRDGTAGKTLGGASRVSHDLKRPSGGNQKTKATLRVTLPVVKTVDGIDIIDHVMRSETTYEYNSKSTQADRDLLVELTKSFNADASIVKSVSSAESF